jgi:hypothetical protein
MKNGIRLAMKNGIRLAMKNGTRIFAILLAAAAMLHAGSARAGYSDGGGFSAPGYGARSWGMGGVIAIPTGEEAIFWNPGQLAVLNDNRLGFSYINIVPGAKAYQSQIAYAHVLKRGTENEPGLSYNKHVVGALYENLSIELSEGESYSENSLRLAYAYSPAYFITVGATFSVMGTSSDIVSFGSSGTAIDVGGRIAVGPGITFAMTVRNALSQLEFDDNLNLSLPRSYTWGLAYTRIPNTALEGNVEAKFGEFSRFVLGGEYQVYSDILSVRGGLSALTAGEGRSVPHMGIGIQYERIRVDYNANFDSEDAFDTTHRFSLGLSL